MLSRGLLAASANPYCNTHMVGGMEESRTVSQARLEKHGKVIYCSLKGDDTMGQQAQS